MAFMNDIEMECKRKRVIILSFCIVIILIVGSIRHNVHGPRMDKDMIFVRSDNNRTSNRKGPEMELVHYETSGQTSFKRDGEFPLATCVNGSKGKYHPLPQHHLKFLPNFKSPCWLEESKADVDNVYINNLLTVCNKGKYNSLMRTGDIIVKEAQKHPRGILIKGPKDDCKTSECRLRCVPPVYVAGVAKSGTTDVCHKLHAHPYILGPYKETYYWSQYRYRINGGISEYSDIFDSFVSELLDRKENGPLYPGMILDCTSITFHDSTYWMEDPAQKHLSEPAHLAPHDIRTLFPGSKFIVILRNPTDRLYSYYNMFIKDGSSEEFHSSVKKQIDWWNTCVEEKKLPIRRCLYGSPPEMPFVDMAVGHRNTMFKDHNPKGLRMGMYIHYVKDWLSVFPREQFFFIRTEDWAKDSNNAIKNKLFSFLGLEILPDQMETEEKVYNKRTYKSSMLNETRKLLDDFYAPFNFELSQFFDDSKWLWRDS